MCLYVWIDMLVLEYAGMLSTCKCVWTAWYLLVSDMLEPFHRNRGWNHEPLRVASKDS